MAWNPDSWLSMCKKPKSATLKLKKSQIQPHPNPKINRRAYRPDGCSADRVPRVKDVFGGGIYLQLLVQTLCRKNIDLGKRLEAEEIEIVVKLLARGAALHGKCPGLVGVASLKCELVTGDL